MLTIEDVGDDILHKDSNTRRELAVRRLAIIHENELYSRVVIYIVDPDLGVGSMGTVSVRVVDGVFRNGKRTDN